MRCEDGGIDGSDCGGRLVCVGRRGGLVGACMVWVYYYFFFQAEDGIRDIGVTGVQTCALPIYAIFVLHNAMKKHL